MKTVHVARAPLRQAQGRLSLAYFDLNEIRK